MMTKVIFIGNKFIYNKELQDYIIRSVEKKVEFIHLITYFKENDTSLFLYLEEELNKEGVIVIATTKQSFATVGKLISTVTSDTLVAKENLLIPQKSSVYNENGFLLEYKQSFIHLFYIDEYQKLPQILLSTKKSSTFIHIFEEDDESLEILLLPIAQTYDVTFEIIPIIDGWIKLKISSSKYGDISKFIASIKQLFSKKVIEKEDIVQHIIEVLSRKEKTISFAESCTGGLLSYYFTKHNGASNIFHGSLITYANELKENWLGIDGEIIQKNGAVSSEVVQEMSDGVMNVSHSDYAISVSGIAGDGGGTKEKPVGTVFIGIRNGQKHQEIKLFLQGDRNYIQHQSALYGIKMLILFDKELFF